MFKSLGIFIFLALAFPAFAVPLTPLTCVDVVTDQRILSSEIEIRWDNNLLPLLKPKSEILEDLVEFEALKAVLDLTESKRGQNPFDGLSYESIKKLNWYQLTPKQQRVVLISIGIIDEQGDFFSNRKISGFSITSRLEFTAKNNFTFRGKEFQSGKVYSINPLDFMWEKIEYASPESRIGTRELELHFKNSNTHEVKEVETFFTEILNVAPSLIISHHTHLPFKRPSKFIEKMQGQGYSNRQIALGLSLYYLKVELSMMVTTFLNRNYLGLEGFYRVASENSSSYDFLRKDKLKYVFQFFEHLVEGTSPLNDPTLPKTILKVNMMGVRWGVFSDNELFSFEARYPNFAASRFYYRLVEKVDHTLETQRFDDEIDFSVLKSLGGVREDLVELLGQSWISTDLETLINTSGDQKVINAAKKELEKKHQILLSREESGNLTRYDFQILGLADWPTSIFSRALGLKFKNFYFDYHNGLVGNLNGIDPERTTTSFLERSGLLRALDLE